MEPGRREAVKRLFERASSLPASERTEFLSQTCAGDHELQAELQSLLEAAGGLEAFFEEPGAPAMPLPPAIAEFATKVTPEPRLVGRAVRQY